MERDVLPGAIVLSLYGRDAGGRFLVLEAEGGYALIADGRLRKTEKPKKKKLKHLRYEGECREALLEKLRGGQPTPNSEVRKEIAAFTRDGVSNGETNTDGGV